MSRTSVAKEMVLAQTRALKMPGAARVYEALGRQAREEHWSHEEYLHEVLAADQTSRQDSAVRQRQRMRMRMRIGIMGRWRPGM